MQRIMFDSLVFMDCAKALEPFLKLNHNMMLYIILFFLPWKYNVAKVYIRWFYFYIQILFLALSKINQNLANQNF